MAWGAGVSASLVGELVHLARNPMFHLPDVVDGLVERHGAKVAAALTGTTNTSFGLLRTTAPR